MKCRLIKISAVLLLCISIPMFLSDAQGQFRLHRKQTVPILETEVQKQSETQEESNPFVWENTLVGTSTGLYAMRGGKMLPLWTGGAVYKLLKNADTWVFLTSEGIYTSSDLVTFEQRNEGLPVLTIKKFDGENKSFVQQTAPLKDLQIDPSNPDIMVTTTKDEVFLSYDAGLSWKGIGFSAKTNGAKAVAVAEMPVDGNPDETELVVFLSHSIYGLSYYKPAEKKPSWKDIETGFEIMKTQSSPDELAEIYATLRLNEEGSLVTEIYISNSFMPGIYKLDWENKTGILLGKDKAELSTIDSLTLAGNRLLYVQPNGFGSFNLGTRMFMGAPESADIWHVLAGIQGSDPQCIWLPAEASGFGQELSFSELWLLDMTKSASAYEAVADNRKSLYVPAGQAYKREYAQDFIDICTENKLDSIVIDMKDDAGWLRYVSKDDKINEKAQSSMYAIDLEDFVPQCKEAGLYLIARIVSFKDKNLWRYGTGQYAVKDVNGGSWLGVSNYNNDEGGISYYDEYWCDPYCEEIWEYNVAIANELISRGFDEIQFDYIRFPTDGLNLNDARYSWKDTGMDKESALMSFLSYARENIDAPISIDIYGANGWYRSGARTGQDVELLSNYVDVICPMFYPSHFEQTFLTYTPVIERPYRVYYYGTWRNTVIGRNRVIIRPWVQAFYLNVSYDKQYYDEEYVMREVYGVRDSVDHGYMYWNNSGRYDDIFPDPGDSPYPFG